MAPIQGPPKSSWAHARIQWADGTNREAWLEAGDGMVFTCAVLAEVAIRLACNQGRPGAYTPGALFGAEMAEEVGGRFILSESHSGSLLPEATDSLATDVSH